MDFELTSMRYDRSDNTLTVRLALPTLDEQGVAVFDIDDLPEVASIFNKAIAQVGGNMLLLVEKATAKPTPEMPVQNLKVEAATLAAIEAEKARLVEEERTAIGTEVVEN